MKNYNIEDSFGIRKVITNWHLKLQKIFDCYYLIRLQLSKIFISIIIFYFVKESI